MVVTLSSTICQSFVMYVLSVMSSLPWFDVWLSPPRSALRVVAAVCEEFNTYTYLSVHGYNSSVQ